MYRLIFAVALTMVLSASAPGLASSFTYQGQLKNDGVPANGSYNLVFKLFDAGNGGAQVGSTITRNGAAINNGLFQQTLDFGDGAFTGDPRWLEITVNGVGLSRQAITAAPMALSVPGLSTGPDGVEVEGDIHTPGEVIASAFSSNSPLIFKVNPGNIECARIEDETCFLGLGIDNPQARLHIGGTPGVDGIRFPDGSLQTTAAGVGAGGFWSASGANIFNNNSGNVGIGTNGPAAARLEVVSATAIAGDNTARFRAPAIGPNASHLHYGTTGDWYIRSASGTGKVVIQDTGGNVGIGPVTPQTKLHLSDAVNSVSHRIETGGGNNAWSRVEFTNGNGQWDIGTSRNFNHDVFYMDRPGGLLEFQLSTWGGLGLGVEPQAKLHLFDPTNSVSHRIQSGGGTNSWTRVEFVNANGQWDIGTSRTFNNDVFYMDRPGGPVEFQLSTWGGLGLGIEPQAKLHLFDPANSVSHRIQSGGGTNSWSRVEFVNGDGQWDIGTSRNFVGNAFYINRLGSNNIAFGVYPNGDAFAQGNMTCKVLTVTGADIAEKFPSTDDKVEPGTVMEIDPDHPGKLRIARDAYSTRVAGVVSGAGDNPAGAILGNFPGSEDAPAIALSGRVWVRCDASGGAIAAGDLLCSSDIPGFAMKATDRNQSHGAILGKAMSPLAQGERGLVLVLVNLQ